MKNIIYTTSCLSLLLLTRTQQRFACICLTLMLFAGCKDNNITNDPPPPAEVTFEGLGDLPGDEFISYAKAVSGDGSVVIGLSYSANGIEAFRWENGVMFSLGDLEGGGFESRAVDISVDGSVVVGKGTSANGAEAFRWENGVMFGLGFVSDTTITIRAEAISADGSVVVGSAATQTPNGFFTSAFLWNNGELSSLDGLSGPDGGPSHSNAFGISADGSVIVGGVRRPDGDGTQASIWVNGEIGVLSSGLSIANAVSRDGSVVVGLRSLDSNDSDQFEAVRWQSGVMTGLGDLANGGGIFSDALGVSSDGSIVVGRADSEMGSQAFIWTEADGMRNLKTVLEDDFGLDLTGWALESANDISDDDTVIVGNGTNPNGDREAWRAFLGAPFGSNQSSTTR